MIQDLNAYPEYKDSGVPWLGEIPAHWGMERAKRLFRKMDRPVQATDEVVTCFRDGVVTLRKNRRVRGFTESLKEIGYQGIRRGDLVIHAMDAFAGAVGVADADGKGTPVYSVCEPAPNANAHYYAYVIREMARSQWILALAKGIRERSTDFRFDGFASQPVLVPPLDEQQRIVAFLDGIDRRVSRFVRAKRRLIVLLNEQKQAILQRAVMRGIDPDVRLKSSGVEWLGEVPEHWEIWQIGRFAKVGNGSTPSRSQPAYWSEGTYPWLNSSSVNQGVIVKAEQFVTDMALRECHLPKVQPGSLLIAITGQGKTRGTAALLSIEATINQHMAYISPRATHVSFKYLQMYLTAAYNELRFISSASGSTKGALTCEDVKHFKVALPPMEEQERLVNAIKEETIIVEAAILRVQSEIDLICEYRTRLIADVVTGKLDVRGLDLANDLGLLADLPDDEPLDEEEELEHTEEDIDADD